MIVNKISRSEFLKYLSKKNPKYHNQKTDLGRGVFASKKEALFEKDLYYQLKSGKIKDYACQVRIPLTVNNIHISDYVMDFVIKHLDDQYEYIETKGFKTQLWKVKWKLLQALYPHYKFTLL